MCDLGAMGIDDQLVGFDRLKNQKFEMLFQESNKRTRCCFY
jgi:hypothetical protein